HDAEHDPLAAEHHPEPLQGLAEVLRAHAGHAGRAPSTLRPHVRRRQVDFFFGFCEFVVDERHAALFSPIWDCTISAYVSLLASNSSCVPRPTTAPSSSTRIWSAF